MKLQSIAMRLANKGKGDFRAEDNTIWLYDVVASDDMEAEWWGGVSPRQFMAALAQTTGPVTLRINSPGGSVFGAQAMVAAMRAHPEPITAQVDSLAASAASVIACEASKLVMAPGALMMIHRAWGIVVGNEEDMRETADLLAKIDGQIAETYARRAGGEKEEYLSLMADETWFTAEEAVSAGLADEVITANNQRPQAKWDLSAYAKAPSLTEDAFEMGARIMREAKQQLELAQSQAEETLAADPAIAVAARTRKLAARLVANPI